jgi:hypothetical protein
MPPTKSVPGLAARALRAVGVFIASRLVQLGLLEDQGLNVLAFDGAANMTVSVHTSEAAGYRPGNVRAPAAQRKWWGCVGCRMLSVLVQKNHCWNVMNGVPMTASNYLRACFFISWVLVSPFLVHWWALVVDLLAIAPFAVAETMSRRWS